MLRGRVLSSITHTRAVPCHNHASLADVQVCWLTGARRVARVAESVANIEQPEAALICWRAAIMVHSFVRQDDFLATLVTACLEDTPKGILGTLESISEHLLLGLLA